MKLKVGIPKEIFPGERRVAATPETVKKMLKLGLEVALQTGAGEEADFLDGAYAEVGATILPDAKSLWDQSDLILKVRPPAEYPGAAPGEVLYESALLKEGARIISFIWPGQNPPLVEALARRGATALAMDAIPRITRAQKMDALTALANLVGYRAVIEAASHFGMFFPGQMTAAGRSKPAQVMIVGAGVAGLSAIATARSLGAQVRAFDTRPAVREQVESLGATFIEFRFDESGEGEGGYAKSMSEAYLAAEQAMIAQHAEAVDIIISTALVPGLPAPKLIASGAVVLMHHGSVIVDLAAEQGGNCALTERDKVVEKFGVKIVGFTDLPSRMARQSSVLYATTVYNLLEDVYDVEKGDIDLDLDDEIHRGVVVLHAGQVMWPPPSRPKPRSAAPLPTTKKPAHKAPAQQTTSPLTSGLMAALAVTVLVAVGLVAPPEFLEHLTVFLLAVVVGWHVIWNVSPALHTPLMSVTNAISGIILIGGVLLIGGRLGTSTVLAAGAVLLAAINVAGGFLVTQRMLRMFRR